MRKFFTFLSFFCLAVQAWSTDYTNGFFILNEEQYGVQPSCLNFYSYEDETVHLRVFQEANPGLNLGETCEFAQIFNGNIYFCSKQNHGAGGRFIVADAKTLKVKYNIADYPSGGDSRAFCGVNATKGYIGTTVGIYVFDIEQMQVTSIIEGTTSDNGAYSGQVGDMVCDGNYVFAAKQGTGVLVINAETDEIENTISISDIATVFEDDGKIYAAVNSASWSVPSESDNEKFVEINSEGIVKETTVPMSCSATWGAWQPSKPAVKGSSLYYNAASLINYLSRYDLSTDTFTQKFVNFTNGYQMYAPCVALEPKTGELIAVTFKGYSNTNYNINFINAESGDITKTIPMNGRYWFSSMILFPEDSSIPTPVERLETERHAITSTYYNLNGTQSNTPFSGFNTIVTTYSDGSRTSTKKIYR